MVSVKVVLGFVYFLVFSLEDIEWLEDIGGMEGIEEFVNIQNRKSRDA